MDFHPDPADQAFRATVREFIASQMSRGRFKHEYHTMCPEWTRTLSAKGWLAPHWPLEWGGTGWSPVRRCIFQEELSAAECPPTDSIALDMVGPIIFTYGSPEQKQRYLPRILHADDVWCQGFSEPHCGSDVTAVRTRAVRDQDSYVVTGQKIWISLAHAATMMFALVRVSVRGTAQKGLTFLLIDMRSPGIEVRPLITIDGRHVINEVFLNDVRVPRSNVIGEEEKGWIYARSLLANERSLIAGIPQTKLLLKLIQQLLRTGSYRGRSLCIGPLIRTQLARLQIELHALEFLQLRVVHAGQNDKAADGLTSVLKFRGAELKQRAHALLMEALGERGLISGFHETGADDAYAELKGLRDIACNFLYSRSASIAGGTNEIQRNIIAGVALGL